MWDQREKELVARDWTIRWQAEIARIDRPLRPGTDPGGRKLVLEDSAPTKNVLRLHNKLYKAESALLIQARTGRIGLARFLHSRKVPGVLTAQCQCRAGEETPRHMALFCTQETDRRSQLMDRNGRKWSYPQLIGANETAKAFVRWMMFSGRLGQFMLAKRLLYLSE
jgi:hypothetical protein